jgi:hypothetical protein
VRQTKNKGLVCGQNYCVPALEFVMHDAWLLASAEWRRVGVTGTEGEPGGAERGPIDASRTPRFAGPPTFALLPRRDEVSRCDVAVIGVPFDSGTTTRCFLLLEGAMTA